MPFVLEIPDDVLDALRFPREEIDRELGTELAVALYARGALSMGKAVAMSRLSRWAFEDVLAERKVERPFTEAEVEHDLDFVNRVAPAVRLG